MAVAAWQISSQSHCGNVRTVNEDSLLVQQHYPLLAIADGMGGHQAGDIASQMLIGQLAILNLDTHLATATQQVSQAIQESNTNIMDYSTRNLKGQTIGSTVVAMLSQGTVGACLWVGDSRLYRHRNHQLQQLTEDHSYVAELVRAGQLLPEEAANHPNANIITRTVGVATPVQVDQLRFDVIPQDTFLLCSDGLYHEVSDSELAQALAAEDIYRASDQLLNLCLRRAAKDNVSFIIARALAEEINTDDTTLTLIHD